MSRRRRLQACEKLDGHIDRLLHMLVVCRCLQQCSVEHSHACRPGSGRPRCTDARQDQRTVAEQTASREGTRAQVAAGLRSRVPLSRLPLALPHRQARLLWCRERVYWRVEWRSVVYSDESKFCSYASDDRVRVRRRPSERLLPECIRP